MGRSRKSEPTANEPSTTLRLRNVGTAFEEVQNVFIEKERNKLKEITGKTREGVALDDSIIREGIPRNIKNIKNIADYIYNVLEVIGVAYMNDKKSLVENKKYISTQYDNEDPTHTRCIY